jgi:hypothetical protein
MSKLNVLASAIYCHGASPMVINLSTSCILSVAELTGVDSDHPDPLAAETAKERERNGEEVILEGGDNRRRHLGSLHMNSRAHHTDTAGPPSLGTFGATVTACPSISMPDTPDTLKMRATYQ